MRGPAVLRPARRIGPAPHTPKRSDPGDQGSETLQLVILVPGLLGMIALIVMCGRVIIAGNSAEIVARDAARAASIARTAPAARQAALETATQSLGEQDLQCTPDIDVDVTGFNRPPGQPAIVTVTISCEVDLADLAFAGMPGSRVLKSTYRSPIDPYRSTTTEAGQ